MVVTRRRFASSAALTVDSAQTLASTLPLFELAALDPATAALAASALGPLLSIGELLFIVRRDCDLQPLLCLLSLRPGL